MLLLVDMCATDDNNSTLVDGGYPDKAQCNNDSVYLSKDLFDFVKTTKRMVSNVYCRKNAIHSIVIRFYIVWLAALVACENA